MEEVINALDIANHVVPLRNGVDIPVLGLGTSHDGGYSHKAVVFALKDCRYRLIDTAKRYGCESFLQEAIKESGVSREDIFLITKLWPTDYGYQSAQSACKQSMKRLGTDYLDSYMLHWPNCPSTCINPKQIRQESWRALEKMYDEGILRTIGVSNFLPSHLEELQETSGLIPHINQVEFHPYQRPSEIHEYCADLGIRLQGYCPLAKARILDEPPVVAVAQNNKKTAAQVLIRWSIQNGVITIPKSTKRERILENSQVFDFSLPNDDMQLLNSLHDGRRCVDITKTQAKIDAPHPLPDGYKLGLLAEELQLTIRRNSQFS